MNPRRTVADLGEFGLIAAIQKHLPDAPAGDIWSGDDAAVVPPPEGRLVLTTDLLVEHIDFELSYCPPASIGVKAMAVNASDVAAMGGIPLHTVATLALPSSTDVEVVDGIAQGLATAGAFVGVSLVGGDISEASEISLGVTVVGSVTHPVTRSGASAGDLICVTGALGGAAAGLHVLREQLEVGENHGPLLGRLAMRQLAPTPRIKEGRYAAELGATAMIDISDGLLADLEHVLDASNVGCNVELDSIPVDEDVRQLAKAVEGIDPVHLALTGGEDYELLFMIPPALRENFESAFEDLHADLAFIGEITEAGRTLGGRNLESWDRSGWEHLRKE